MALLQAAQSTETSGSFDSEGADHGVLFSAEESGEDATGSLHENESSPRRGVTTISCWPGFDRAGSLMVEILSSWWRFR